MLDALKFISAVIGDDLRNPNRAPECEAGQPKAKGWTPNAPDGSGCERVSLAQIPQVPPASEDAFGQVPGNAETAVGEISVRDVKRFVAKINATDSCWFWTGAKSTRGYGEFHFSGRQWRAHRFSHLLFKGDVPNDKVVCHTCDTPLCVNPSHLFLGTQRDNILDMMAKGRWNAPPGGRSKLTEEAVRRIKSFFGTLSISEIARRFSMSRRAIQRIRAGVTWKHLGAPIIRSSRREETLTKSRGNHPAMLAAQSVQPSSGGPSVRIPHSATCLAIASERRRVHIPLSTEVTS